MQEERYTFSPSSVIDGYMPVVNMCRNSIAHRTQYAAYQRHKYMPFFCPSSILDDVSSDYSDLMKMSNSTFHNITVPYLRVQLPVESMTTSKGSTQQTPQNGNDATDGNGLQADSTSVLATLPVKRTLDGTVKSSSETEHERATQLQDDVSNSEYQSKLHDSSFRILPFVLAKMLSKQS